MRIELDIDLKAERRARRDEPSPEPSPPNPVARTARLLRRIALAQHIDHLVQTGQVASYAEIARMCGVSRAAVSRVATFLSELDFT